MTSLNDVLAAYEGAGGFSSPNASISLAAVASAESASSPSGSFENAINPSSGATGLAQDLNIGNNSIPGTSGYGARLDALQDFESDVQTGDVTGGGLNLNPQSSLLDQNAEFNVSEIQSGSYPSTLAALNNPSATTAGQENVLINNYEGLGGSPGQAAQDAASAASVTPQLTTQSVQDAANGVGPTGGDDWQISGETTVGSPVELGDYTGNINSLSPTASAPYAPQIGVNDIGSPFNSPSATTVPGSTGDDALASGAGLGVGAQVGQSNTDILGNISQDNLTENTLLNDEAAAGLAGGNLAADGSTATAAGAGNAAAGASVPAAINAQTAQQAQNQNAADTTNTSLAGSIETWFDNLFARGAFIVLGLIMLGAGLFMLFPKARTVVNVLGKGAVESAT